MGRKDQVQYNKEGVNIPEKGMESPILRRRTVLKLAGVTGSAGLMGSASASTQESLESYGYGGYGEGGYGGNDTAVAVITVGASVGDDTTVTFYGELTGLGGASSADVFFQYRMKGATQWNTSAMQTLSTKKPFDETVTSLQADTTYEFRAIADASDGDSDAGSTHTVTTTGTPDVTTAEASGVDETAATLNGELTDLGGASDADVYFKWGKSDNELGWTTRQETVSSTSQFSRRIDGLDEGTEYSFKAVATASNGDSDSGSVRTFTTATASSAPTIDEFQPSEAGKPNPHAEITVDWAVSDADGDLSAVSVGVLDPDGGVVDSRLHSSDGSTANGSDEFKIKHGGGTSYDVLLTVTDEQQNENKLIGRVQA